MKKELTCIVCPIGCHITATREDDGRITDITGNTCPRGKAYAETELTHPTRTLTSTVTITNRPGHMLPVKTSVPLSKERLFEAMAIIRKTHVTAPITCGTVILENLLGETDLIASGSVE